MLAEQIVAHSNAETPFFSHHGHRPIRRVWRVTAARRGRASSGGIGADEPSGDDFARADEAAFSHEPAAARGANACELGHRPRDGR